MSAQQDVIKRCTKCGILRNITEFNFRNIKKDIRGNVCKVCVKKYNRKYREDNEHKIKDKKREYYYKNKQKISNINKEYYRNSSERIKYKRLEYYYKNKEKERRYMRKYSNNRLKNDPLYKLKITIKKRIRASIKYNHVLKNKSWRDLLGCDVSFIRDFIERKFYDHPRTGEQMMWENHGKWEIDHVLPVSLIKSTEDAEQMCKIFHYSNLQPLWKEENSNKRSKLGWDREKYWKMNK